MSEDIPGKVKFGPFEADLHTHELWKEGIRLKLIGQPFEILAVLVSKPGRLVTREELRAELWPADTFVDFNHGLNAAINRLRDALCDSAENPRYIETLPRRGYRFIAAVESLARKEEPCAEGPKAPELTEHELARIEPSPRELDDGPVFVSSMVPTGGNAQTVRERHIWRRLVTPALLPVVVLFAGLAGFFLSHRPSQIRVGRRPLMPVASLTDLADPTSDPAFSPDGTRVAFRRQGYAPGTAGIFVKKIGSQQLLQLTANASDCCPAWSPNGRTIAFSRFSEKEREILTVAAGGGELHKLYATSFGPKHGELDWSPDGSSIAFVGESEPGTSSIFLLSKDSTAHRITEPSPFNRDWGPAYSPDGQSLAFIRTHQTGLPENILVMPADGGESRAVVTFYNGILGPPAWTRDSQSLVFASGNEPTLLRAPVFGGGELSRIEEAGTSAWHPAIARQGNYLAYQKVLETVSIWELDPTSANETKQHGLVVSESGRNEAAQISPDGKKLVFASTRSGRMEIWVSDRDGSNPHQVTAMGGVGTPHWSPNSRSIAFDVGWRDRGAVFVVDVPGGLPRPLAQDNSNNLVPNWSRDGKWVYFASNRTGLWQVWQAPARGGPAVQLTTHGGFFAYPSWDGESIYYSKFNLPDPEVWRVARQGGMETRIPQVRPEDWASWAPVEKGIYFLAKDLTGRPNVMFFDSGTSDVRKVESVDRVPFWLSASPDGKALLYEHLDQENSHIMLLRNFQ